MNTATRTRRLLAAAVALSASSTLPLLWSAGPASAQIQNVPSDIGVPLSTPELLANGSFASGMSHWAATPGQNVAVYASGAGEGSTYLETNTNGASSGSVSQDVGTVIWPGHSYAASLLLRSPAATSISASVVVWAIGGSAPVELGQTAVTVSSSSWTRVSTDLDVAYGGHAMLRFQVYMTTSGANLDLDGASLQDAGLGDAAFSQAMGPWHTATGQNRAIYQSSDAPDGQNYLETNSGSANGPTVYQDVAAPPLYGHTYVAAVYLRSPSGNPVSVTLDLWAIGGPASTDLGHSNLTVTGSGWSVFYTDVDVAHFGHDELRFQLYLNTPGVNLDVAGATLQDGRVADSGFDQPGIGPWVVSSGANAAVKSGSGAVSGTHWLETNTGSTLQSSLSQDLPSAPQAGYSYQGSMLLRTTTGSPATVTLVIWALAGSAPPEMAQTTFSVGTTWAQYSTELDVNSAGHGLLRFEMFLQTPGQTVAVGGASLPDQTMGPGLTPLRQSIVALAETQDQYGAAITENPVDSNCNPFTYVFGRGSTTGDYSMPCAPGTRAEEWCSDFANWAWVAAGLRPNVTGWAYTWVRYGQDTGTFKQGSTNTPEPGDAVVWGDMGAQYGAHVGIVVGVADGMINVVSGNSGPDSARGNPYSVWESGYFDPSTSADGSYSIVGYTAPDGFTGS